MKIIYTITFNPALDYVITVDHFETGVVNRTKEEHVNYGGKGLNVSVILQELGYANKALGFIAGFTGKEIERGAKKELGVETDFIEVKEGLSRINVKMRSDNETEINGMGPCITKEDVAKLFSQLEALQEGDILVCSGSIPGSIDNDIYERILEKLTPKGVECVVDATGDLLMKVLPYHPFLVKPNNHELGEIYGVELKTKEDIIAYAKKMQEDGAKNVLVSMAGDGSLLVDAQGIVHQMGVCKGKVKNSVGAGDSMVAGFVAGYLKNHDYHEALQLATACGGATAFSYALATKEYIEEMLQQLRGE